MAAVRHSGGRKPMARQNSTVRVLHQALIASTALVGIRILPQPAQSVLHVPSSASLLQARMARLLALAIETPGSLLAPLTETRSPSDP